jgi:hypothetical protein
MRKAITRLFGLSVLGAVGFALWRSWGTQVRGAAGTGEWEQAPFPFPPVPRPNPGPVLDLTTPAPPWVEPAEGGVCPRSHPVKGKLGSGIYHVPGGMNYERTHADRCYVDTEAAEVDGLRHAKL